MFIKVFKTAAVFSILFFGLSACSNVNTPQTRNAVEVSNAMMAVQSP